MPIPDLQTFGGGQASKRVGNIKELKGGSTIVTIVEPPFTSSNEREVVLSLMDVRIRGYVDISEVFLDLLKHTSFGGAKCLRHIRVYAQRRLPNIFGMLRQPPCLAQDLVADGCRRFHPARAFAVFARSAHRTFERLLHSLSGHDDKAEVVE